MHICLECGQEIEDVDSHRCGVCGGPVVAICEPSESLIGRTLGKYRLLEKLSEGGMGAVYRAKQEDLDRPVAIKVLQLNKAKRKDAIRRFYAEAKHSSKLRHPNNASVYEFGHTEDGLVYIAMELVDGRPLSSIELPIPCDRALRMAYQICGALDEAHRLGLVHRDLKPENIMLSEVDGQDYVHVLDYGVAKVVNSSTGLTEDGGVVGTPQYMSPEQIAGEPIDARTDIYALGVTLYEIVTGRPPFATDDSLALLYMHKHEAPALPSSLIDVPRPVEDLILSCLAKRRQDRPRSMTALRREVERLLGGRPQGFTPLPMRMRVEPAEAHADPSAGGARPAPWKRTTVKTPVRVARDAAEVSREVWSIDWRARRRRTVLGMGLLVAVVAVSAFATSVGTDWDSFHMDAAWAGTKWVVEGEVPTPEANEAVAEKRAPAGNGVAVRLDSSVGSAARSVASEVRRRTRSWVDAVFAASWSVAAEPEVAAADEGGGGAFGGREAGRLDGERPAFAASVGDRERSRGRRVQAEADGDRVDEGEPEVRDEVGAQAVDPVDLRELIIRRTPRPGDGPR